MNIKLIEQDSEANLSIFLIVLNIFSARKSMLIVNMVMPVVFSLFSTGGNEETTGLLGSGR